MSPRQPLSTIFLSALYVVFLLCPATVNAQEKADVIAQGATLKEVKAGFTFTEGPAADAEGNVYFSDVRGGGIYKWNYKDGNISRYREHTGQPNGLMFDQKGRLVICEMDNNRLTLDDMKGKTTVLAESSDSIKLNSPNDLWIDPKGGIYFSDWLRGRGGKGGGRKGGGGGEGGGLQIYYISPDKKGLAPVTNDLIGPNGLIGTPDGKSLYVADARGRTTWRYNIQADGTLTGKKSFCGQGSDGMALDEHGNVYLTDRAGLVVYNSKGQKIKDIPVPASPTNMTFAGKERKTLFITARTSVYTLEMAVRGAPSPLDRAR
ncbi:MAG: SMP-30/gluconolactonase/LRE family protein [Deltaproteobacteria bacterium]|nr:SMP-30/gluconolactonase/LRE family protein [Deltaproteobacteria bacterium]